MDSSHWMNGLAALGQPPISSIYDATGTPDTGYAESGPYSCKNCIHKTAMDEPFCVHPKVVADSRMQDRLVTINNRPAVKICLEHGCCEYVRQPAPPAVETKEEVNEQ